MPKDPFKAKQKRFQRYFFDNIFYTCYMGVHKHPGVDHMHLLNRNLPRSFQTYETAPPRPNSQISKGNLKWLGKKIVITFFKFFYYFFIFIIYFIILLFFLFIFYLFIYLLFLIMF